MKDFFDEWKRYLSVLLSPDVVLCVIGAVFLGYWSDATSDISARTIGTVLMALLTGLAGARISKKIIEDSRSEQVFTRGQSAVRGLGLILTNLVTLESQLERARAEARQEEAKKDFSYIKSLSVIIQRQAVNSMEEWKDILPESDIEDLLREMKNKLNETNDLREALDEIQSKLDQSQNAAGAKDDEVKALLAQKVKLEKELREKELAAFRIVPSAISGSLIGATSFSSPTIFPNTDSLRTLPSGWGKGQNSLDEKK